MSDPPRLLVVDDDHGALRETCAQLGNEDYNVTRCEGSHQALLILREQRFDLLLSDFRLPGPDGAGLVGQATDLHPDIVAVLVTSPDTADSAIEAMAGLVDYIRKPFRMSEMRAVVTRALDMGRLRVENSRLSQAVAHSNAQLAIVSRELDKFTGRVEAPEPQKPRALRVLVIDDDPTVLLSLQNMLELDGHSVSTAGGGQIGVEAFELSLRQGAVFDVVITDFGMPHMDGREVARAIKLASASTLVIMLTGWGSPVDEMEGWQQYVDDVLSKPPRLAQMRQALAAAGKTAQLVP